MPWIDTTTEWLDHPASHLIYNGLDTMVTLEVHEALQAIEPAPLAYNFSRALQGPVLAMQLRGFAVDDTQRRSYIALLRKEVIRLREQLNRQTFAVWDKPINPNSTKQLQDLFYGHMGIPEIWISEKGQRKLSMKREVLEKLEAYVYARSIAAHVIAVRDREKQIQTLETEVDPDGRMRTSYNIAGTETGRFSSSSSAFGTGGNLQNIAPRLRRMFVADPGYVLCTIDLEQAESREVGWLCGTLFGDWTYLDACEGGDLHTLTCKLIWPTLPWPGDRKGDRAIADRTFYREYSYRDMSKRGGHGCLTEDHEVLTPNGWVSIAEKPPVIMQWEPSGRSSFAQVTHWTDKEWTGEFHTWEGTSLSLNMTADHRVIYTTDDKSYCVCNPSGVAKSGKIPLGSGYIGGNAALTPAVARLIAAFQCDGHQQSTNRISFHLRKQRKKDRLLHLAHEANFWCENRGDKIVLDANGWPKHAGAYLLTWPAAALRAYIEEHKHWDGHISATAQALFSTNKEHLEWLQTIGRLLGIGGNFQKPSTSGYGSTVWKLQQNNRQFAWGKALQKTTHHATKRVLCPSVPTKFFYVRRKGRISITGNSNYYGSAFTMARHLKVPTPLMTSFQERYFGAFPAIPRWHRAVAEQLQTTQTITNAFGLTRTFFSRPNDDTTLRAAIAHGPQSSTAYRTNLALYRIWSQLPVEVLAQTHDSVTFQIPSTHQPEEIIPEALRLMEVTIVDPASGRACVVPGEAKVGWNWGNYSEELNPDGLRKWGGTMGGRERKLGLDRVYE